MIPGYAYRAMSVTGSLHFVLGVSGLITAIVGLGMLPHLYMYYGVALFVSLWFLLVGCLGIWAGMKKHSYKKIQKIKIAYMVTAILSACVFCGIASWMYILTELTTTGVSNLNIYAIDMNFHTRVHFIRFAGGIITSLEFILAIVSSSICCCCSSATKNLYTYNVVPYQDLDDEELLFQQPLKKKSFRPNLRP